MEMTNELAMRVTQRIIKDLELELDIACCFTDDHVYDVITGLVQYNKRKALAWKCYQNNIDYKCI